MSDIDALLADWKAKQARYTELMAVAREAGHISRDAYRAYCAEKKGLRTKRPTVRLGACTEHAWCKSADNKWGKTPCPRPAVLSVEGRLVCQVHRRNAITDIAYAGCRSELRKKYKNGEIPKMTAAEYRRLITEAKNVIKNQLSAKYPSIRKLA